MKSNSEWLEWGKRDPLQGVATWPGKERGGANPWTDEEFYALGVSEWADFSRQWTQYGINPGHCVEIGCGAGRMTRQLAGTFAKVTALDISPDQIAYARERIPDAHVNFVVTDGTSLPLPDKAVTALFTCYVLQHFSSTKEAAGVLREIGRVVAPGGSICVQIPLYHLPETKARGPLRWLNRWERRIAGWKTDWQHRRGKLAMRMTWYERDWLDAELRSSGFKEIEFRAIRMTANNHWSDLLLARKG